MIRVLCLLLAAAMLGGCATSSREVSRRQLTELQRAMPRVQVGMTKPEVFEAIPPHGYQNLVGTTTLEGARLEEWIIEAHWKASGLFGGPRIVPLGESFGRYLYFIDDTLTDMTMEPLSYRDRQAMVVEWRGDLTVREEEAEAEGGGG